SVASLPRLRAGRVPPGARGSAQGGRRHVTEPRRYTTDLLTDMFRNPLDVGYAEAARRRAEHGPDPVRVRAASRGVRVLILVGLGFLLAVAYQQTRAAQPESSKVHAGLVTDVKNRQTETDAMQRRADRLRDQVSQERDSALGADTAAVRTLEENAGVSKVRGAGALVKLADAAQPVDPGTGKATGTNPGQVQDR